MNRKPLLLLSTQDAQEALQKLDEVGEDSAYVVDSDKRLQGYVNRKDLKDKSGWIDEYIHEAATSLPLTMNLRDALSEMLMVDYSNICVVDNRNRVRGTVNTAMIQEAVAETRSRGKKEEA